MMDAQRIKEEAIALGFDMVSWVPAESLEEEGGRLRQWLADGQHGDMAWFAKNPERRSNPMLVLPDCRNVIVLGMHYQRPEVPQQSGPVGKVSKYARTRDYHRVIEKRLRKLCRRLDEEFESQSRGYVDYGPVMERPWADRAGLGFTGKHTLLINPKEGSFFFLSVILTTAELPQVSIPPMTQSCGYCRRCIDACPTGAITEPWKLDARRCLSYLTIEKEGDVDREFWPHYEGNVFGCDICQDVCPYNKSRGKVVEESPLGPLLFPPSVPLSELLRDPAALIESAGEAATPLKRAGVDSLRRNGAIVASERGGPEELQALLDVMKSEELPHWLRTVFQDAVDRLHCRMQGRI